MAVGCCWFHNSVLSKFHVLRYLQISWWGIKRGRLKSPIFIIIPVSELPRFLSLPKRNCPNISLQGVGLTGIVLACELFPAEQRTFAGIALQFFWSIAWFLLALFAYLIRDWRKLQIALSLPCLFTLSYVWFVQLLNPPWFHKNKFPA